MSSGRMGLAVSARELAELIVEGLNLQGMNPAEMDLRAPLFDGGLGLDSLDILEIALLIQQRYGVKLKADDPNNLAIFSSLSSLADHITASLVGQT